MRLNSRALCLLALLAPALSGCFLTTSSTSQIEQGQAITTGKKPYDTFFQEVRAVREESLKSEAEAASARAALLRALGLQEQAKTGEAIAAARAHAAKLKAAGVLLHLDIVPEAKVNASGKPKLEADDERIHEAIEESTKSSIAVVQKLDQLSTRAADLEKQRKTLSDSPATFDTPTQRDQVKREIQAAEQVLADAMELSGKHAASASKFVLDLALAIETGAEADTGERTAAAKPARPPAGRKPPPKGSPPAAASPQTPAKPPPKPPSGEDFEP